jgi:hypothetical protein
MPVIVVCGPPGRRHWQGTLHDTTTFLFGTGSVLRIATVVRVDALGLCVREATLDIHNKAGHQQKRGINITPHVDRILALNKERQSIRWLSLSNGSTPHMGAHHCARLLFAGE